ncbi:MAG TPA: F0F1 ATP synthase subunit epsilon [Desulfobacteraceae bacterium]|nr:F0F1 ATP synthase subunit epsilon [Desulfobacteraceae bacterium]HPJ67615.1 F0F1 ATP synthase subunit epsilon [Desulfobacteraceae bacterium]
MRKLTLEIVTPDKLVASEEVDMVIAPGVLGEFGVLEGHIPFLSGINPGELRFTIDDKIEYYVITYGFAEISDNKVSILVDAAERSDKIDLNRAQKALERAKERLEMERSTQGIDFARAESAFKRATARIMVAEKVK